MNPELDDALMQLQIERDNLGTISDLLCEQEAVDGLQISSLLRSHQQHIDSALGCVIRHLRG